VLDVADHAAVIAFCHIQKIGLVVIGPEAPLVAGPAPAPTRSATHIAVAALRSEALADIMEHPFDFVIARRFRCTSS
jgi:phosphoribosylamine-glycine ligase